WGTLTMRRVDSNPLRIRSVRDCHPCLRNNCYLCLRNELLPMSQERTGKVWLRGPATNCTGSSVGRQRKRENAGVSDGGARCSTLGVVTTPGIATTTRAISAAGVAAAQTHVTATAWILATCSWSTSTCLVDSNESTSTITATITRCEAPRHVR